MRRFLSLLLVVFLCGCGTARTIALDPVDSRQAYSNVKLVAHNPTVEVPAEVTDKIESVIRQGLIEEGPFIAGDDLTIQYTFISHDSGDRFSRWFFGGLGNAGEGSVVVRVNYLDRDGNQIARTQVEGRIGTGFFGGSINSAVAKAGDDIVEYTLANFGPGR